MKTAVFYGKKDVRIEDRPIPVAGPGQIVVKIDCVGLCGTDVDAFQTGSFLAKGMVLGHENIGIVAEIGAGVEGFAIGDRLLCGPPSACSISCPQCARGDTSICLNALPKTRGIGGPDGGYAEYMLIDDVAHAVLPKIPDNVDSKDAVLFDVVCVGIHAIRLSRLKFGDNVVVSGGGGPVGLSVIRLLKAAGVRKIAVLQTGPLKVQKIMEFGADICIDPTTTKNIEEELIKFFGTGETADVTFECAGKKESLHNCLYHCTRPGGQVMMVGQVTQGIDNIIPSDFFVKEIDLQPSFVFTEKDINIYIDMLAGDRISFPGMVTDVISLSECVEKGLDLEREARRSHIKIIIDPSRGNFA